MIRYLRYITLLLFFSLRMHAVQAADLSDHPGFLDLDQLPFLAGREANVEVTLNGPVLNMLLELPIQYDENGQVKELLKVVDQILVRIYTTTPEEAEGMLALIGDTSETLEQQDWARIVRVREGSRDDDLESVDIHVKLSEDGKNLNGLVIMAVETKRGGEEAEVVFVNIAGNFDPAYLANIGKQFDIDQLEGVEIP